MDTAISGEGSPADGRTGLRTPFRKTGFEPATLVDLLRWRASHAPERPAYIFLGDGKAEERAVNYGEPAQPVHVPAPNNRGEFNGDGGANHYPHLIQAGAPVRVCAGDEVAVLVGHRRRWQRPGKQMAPPRGGCQHAGSPAVHLRFYGSAEGGDANPRQPSTQPGHDLSCSRAHLPQPDGDLVAPLPRYGAHRGGAAAPIRRRAGCAYVADFLFATSH